MAVTFESRRAEYAALWKSMSLRPERASEVRATARRILAGRLRYDEVSHATGVPWYVIGIMHSMECSLSFSKHLHNGDPLDKPTVQVPKGRGPFATWEESAIDAVRYDRLDRIETWDVEHIAFALETMNGFGYLRHGIHSPYLWSFTTAYTSGKYVADGVWSSTAVSQQCGGMAILKALIEMEQTLISVDGGASQAQAETWAKAPLPPAPTVTGEAAQSKSVWTLGTLLALLWSKIMGGIGWLSDRIGDLVQVMDATSHDVEGTLAPAKALAKLVQVNLEGAIWASVVTGLVVVVASRHVRDKIKLKVLSMIVPAAVAAPGKKGV